MAEAAQDDPGERDVRPVVARRRPSNLGLWVFLVALVAGGAWLFNLMSASRMQTDRQGALSVVPEAGTMIRSPAPLALPRDYGLAERSADRTALRPTADPFPVRILAPVPPPPPPPARSVSYSPTPAPAPTYEAPRQAPAQPAVVFDRELSPKPPPAGEAGAGGSERVTAGRLANPSLTIPRGTVIPAVLETALDSTRPGGVRALVQRDVYGFDGTRVLVQRGSRLYGEYRSDLAPGQKRALVQWTRLLRPDGVTIALDSPASDPLGRAGIRGDVDSKFFQRFGGAILQSVLDIGVGIGTRKATDGVVVALPGSTQNLQVDQQQQVQPTLKVRHGTSVSVFVARDLDFSTVDR